MSPSFAGNKFVGEHDGVGPPSSEGIFFQEATATPKIKRFRTVLNKSNRAVVSELILIEHQFNGGIKSSPIISVKSKRHVERAMCAFNSEQDPKARSGANQKNKTGYCEVSGQGKIR